MGLVLEEFGPWVFEVRRESFVLSHAEHDGEAVEFERHDLHYLKCAIDDLDVHLKGKSDAS